jgi:DNA-binding GntR family transcriptional regulator
MALRLAINNGEADCERRSSQRVTGSSGVANRGTSDLRGLGEAASRLPFQLIAACGSLRLLSFWGELYDHFDRYRRIAVLQTRRYPSLSSSHRDIVEGVLARKSNECFGDHHYAWLESPGARNGRATTGRQVAAPKSLSIQRDAS